MFLGTSIRLKALACALMALVVCAGDGMAAQKKGVATPPDFTKGGQKDESHDWNLGPTGARGWLFGMKGQTFDARQILITEVAKGSPADGTLQKDDVILGIGSKDFTDDARVQFANAITAAEENTGGGSLKLLRWRAGKTETVTIKLATLGSYSATAPYNCPKSKKIFDLGCEVIAKGQLNSNNIPNNLNALALLASGRSEYKAMVTDFAKLVAAKPPGGYVSWGYGYSNLFLAEYILATGDKSVLPDLTRYAKEVALGASAVGTWGHRFAREDGNLNGYGCMNLPGLTLVLGLVVAREAGVKDPAVDRTITKASGFLRWYVNKGAIPYGDHLPWPGHEDNGKCSIAAVLFDLLGDKEAATYYAKMATAAYSERERGHTGNFFNVLWAYPGVSRAGELAAGAYMKEQSWYYDLARKWDGSFGYLGSPIGEEEHGKYTKWDCTGAYLLSFALPLKSLYITGKKKSSVTPLTADEVKEVIDAGRDYFSTTGKNGYAYEGRSTEKLFLDLKSWSPAVRKRAAHSLAQLPDDFVSKIIPLLSSKDNNTRYGAVELLGELGPRADAAGPQLRKLLTDSDSWMQYLACEALVELGPEERKASVSDLLIVASKENPDDPRRITVRAASRALFAGYPGARQAKSILAESLDGVDRDLLYPAIRAVLQNDDGAARGTLNRIYGKLSDADVVELMPDIIKAIQKLAPSNEMFADGIRIAGLDLLSRLYIREGMELCISTIEMERWGQGDRLPKCLNYLKRYGAHAKEMLPQLQSMRDDLMKTDRQKEKSEKVILLDKVMGEIKAATKSPTLVNAKDFKSRK